MAKNPRRIRPERTLDQLLADEDSMAVLRAVKAGTIVRSGPGPTAGHLLDGRPVTFQLRRLADEDRVRLPMAGRPQLWGDSNEVLDADRVDHAVGHRISDSD